MIGMSAPVSPKQRRPFACGSLLLARAGIVLAMMLGALAARGASAADQVNAPVSLADWVIRSWEIEDGLPQNTVNAMVQTRDGFLWVGTNAGLARFDGVRFRTFGLQEGLRSVLITTLVEDRQGTLWVGTSGG